MLMLNFLSLISNSNDDDDDDDDVCIDIAGSKFSSTPNSLR